MTTRPWTACPQGDPLDVVDQLIEMERRTYNWGSYTHSAYLDHLKFGKRTSIQQSVLMLTYLRLLVETNVKDG